MSAIGYNRKPLLLIQFFDVILPQCGVDPRGVIWGAGGRRPPPPKEKEKKKKKEKKKRKKKKRKKREKKRKKKEGNYE